MELEVFAPSIPYFATVLVVGFPYSPSRTHAIPVLHPESPLTRIRYRRDVVVHRQPQTVPKRGHVGGQIHSGIRARRSPNLGAERALLSDDGLGLPGGLRNELRHPIGPASRLPSGC